MYISTLGIWLRTWYWNILHHDCWWQFSTTWGLFGRMSALFSISRFTTCLWFISSVRMLRFARQNFTITQESGISSAGQATFVIGSLVNCQYKIENLLRLMGFEFKLFRIRTIKRANQAYWGSDMRDCPHKSASKLYS